MILLIDTDAMVRRMVEETLLSYGYTGLAADDPTDGLRLLHELQEQISLLIVDVALPGIMGPKFVQAARVINPEVPTLFISGYPEAMTRASRRSCLSVPYLEKPFGPAELMRAIRGATQNRARVYGCTKSPAIVHRAARRLVTDWRAEWN